MAWSCWILSECGCGEGVGRGVWGRCGIGVFREGVGMFREDVYIHIWVMFTSEVCVCNMHVYLCVVTLVT